MKTDSRLQHDVLAQLEWEPSVEASHIGVAAENGVVTLSGSVATFKEKLRAEEVTKRLYGVLAVADDIEVEVPGSHAKSDAEIAAAALSTLPWHTSVPDDKLKVTVRNGWVVLEGTVAWRFQRDAAEEAFKRSGELDARRVHVAATDGKVTLRDHVRSWTARDEAQQAAWAALGVTEVSNQPQVSL